MKKIKKIATIGILLTMSMQIYLSNIQSALAGTIGDLVINEVSWMGSADGSNDEWIELYNNTSQTIDLTGWTIEDDTTTVYTIGSKEVGPKGYFLIEDSEESTNVQSDVVIPISLANTGDSLILKDENGTVIDSVNTSGGAWFAGDSTTKGTMERIDPEVDGDSSDNWATSTTSNGAVGRDGTEILGTPKSTNSNYGGSGPIVSMTPSTETPSPGGNMSFSVSVNDAVDLYSYGMDVIYDPAVFTYVDAQEGAFLNADGTDTSFQASLEDGTEGKVVVGNARMVNPPVGIDGQGELFQLNFQVKADASGETQISFGANSFLSDSTGDVLVQFSPTTVNVITASDLSLENLTGAEATEIYELELTWSGSGATAYKVYRKNVGGDYVQIGETDQMSFIDNQNITTGITYEYKVVATNGSVESSPLEVTVTESRGLAGDNNRSRRVDGRDLENLARSYGSGFGDEEYNQLVDTTYDGLIDGNDLIDIGVNFGMTY